MAQEPRWIVEKRNPRWSEVLEDCISELRRVASMRDLMVVFKPVARTLDQNAKFHPMLRDIAGQVPVNVRGQMVLVDEKDWKAIATATFENETRFAEFEGRIVVLGTRTSDFSKEKCVEFIEYLYWLGSEYNVIWSEKAKDHFARYGATESRRPASPLPA